MPSPNPTRTCVDRAPVRRESTNKSQLLEDSLLNTDPEVAEIMVIPIVFTAIGVLF
jgi:hypothetical protein